MEQACIGTQYAVRDYTAGDIAQAMRKVVPHIVNPRDRDAAKRFDEATWLQLAIGAMSGTPHELEGK